MIDYRLTVKCSACYTITTYTNEHPQWHDGQTTPTLISIAQPYRYIVCPACDGEALPYDATETTPAAEQATS